MSNADMPKPELNETIWASPKIGYDPGAEHTDGIWTESHFHWSQTQFVRADIVESLRARIAELDDGGYNAQRAAVAELEVESLRAQLAEATQQSELEIDVSKQLQRERDALRAELTTLREMLDNANRSYSDD